MRENKNLERACFPLKRTSSTAVFPAKAGTQIHPERLVGFTWAPAFIGQTEEGSGDSETKNPALERHPGAIRSGGALGTIGSHNQDFRE
jgi:hypothetical protein